MNYLVQSVLMYSVNLPDEVARIEALNRYEILDTPAEPQFDRITALARDICEAPIALISLVDSERLWFKSKVGLDVSELPRDTAFCAHAILKPGLFIAPDTATDERFSDNPLVSGSPNIRTYMGAPLVTKEGYRVGTLCVLYSQVTTIREEWKERLNALVAIVIDQLEARVAHSVAEEGEARFRDIAEASGEWIWESDENHRFTYISKGKLRSEFDSSQLIGLTRWEFPGVEINTAQYDAHEAVLEQHQPFRNFEYYFIGERGKRQHRRASGKPVFSKDGNFRGYRGTTTDITERVEIFETLENTKNVLEKSNADYRRTLMLLPDAAYITVGGTIVFSNNAANRIFGASDGLDLCGMDSLGLFHPEDRSIVLENRKAVLQRNEYVENVRHRHIKLDGTELISENAAAAITWDGEDALIAIFRDITEQIRTNDALLNAIQESDAANTAKSEFLANMSHELRTPLNAIIGFSDLMLSAAPDAFTQPEYVEYTSDIRNSGMDLLKIVNDILDLSKVEAGHSELNEEPVDIPTVVRSIVQRLSVQAAEANLTVSLLLADNLPPLLADKLKLKQILINLLSNAIKFTPSGGMITVSADFSPEAGHLIKVSDTGIGLAPEDVKKVLLPFQQVDSSLSRKYDGTGLGLPLASSFAEMHGGTLKIASEVDVGTTVEIRFPAARAIQTGSQSMDVSLSLDEAV